MERRRNVTATFAVCVCLMMFGGALRTTMRAALAAQLPAHLLLPPQQQDILNFLRSL